MTHNRLRIRFHTSLTRSRKTPKETKPSVE